MADEIPTVYFNEEARVITPSSPFGGLGPVVFARRLVGGEKWIVEVLVNEPGYAVGYSKRDVKTIHNPFGMHRRVSLGMAMGCVKDEDTVLLPLQTVGALNVSMAMGE